MKKNIFRFISVIITLTCIVCMSGCHMFDVTVKWSIPSFTTPVAADTASSADITDSTTTAQLEQTTQISSENAAEQNAAANTTDAPQVTTDSVTQTAVVESTTAQPTPTTAYDIYSNAAAASTVTGVVLGSKFSGLTIDIGDKETFDGLGNAHDFSKEHEFGADEIAFPTFTADSPLTMEETDTAYIIKCESTDEISTQIPVRQVTGYVYFLDIAAVDGILSLIGSDKADNAIYSGMGDGAVSLKNGAFECTVDKATMKLTDARVVYEETFNDIVSLSFPKEFSADLTMNITLGFTF